MEKQLGKYALILTPEMTNGHLEYKVPVPEGVEKLHFKYSVGKIWEKDPKLVEENYETYVENHPLYGEHPDEGEGIRNLITVTINSPSKYFGSSHRFTEYEEIIISKDHSTAGFIKGAIEPGFWRIAINCHTVVTENLFVQCECFAEGEKFDEHIEALKIIEPKKAKKERPQRDIDKMRFHKVELHAHTLHSDATFTTKELIEAAKKENIEYLAITDHNTEAPFDEVGTPEGISVMHGMELTTFFGHILLHNPKAFDGIDWTTINLGNINEVLHDLKEKGFFIGSAHPFSMGSPYCTGCQWNYVLKNLENIDYIEVWNSFAPYLEPANLDAFAKWTQLLDKGVQIPASAGRDWHRPDDRVPQSIYVQATENATHEEIFKAIQMGHTFLSAGPTMKVTVNGNASIGDILPKGKQHFDIEIENNGIEKAVTYKLESNLGDLKEGKVTDTISFDIDVPKDALYLRLSFFNEKGYRVMFTNPFYF